jgi:GNAT superfamily N-acetyltransferase
VLEGLCGVADFWIDRASPQDAGELLTVQRAAFVSEAQLYGDPLIPPLTETLAGIRDAIAATDVLVACEGRRVIGGVRGRLAGRTCEVDRLVVAPDRQGRGIGTALMEELERRHARNADQFTLFTGAQSEGNLRLYARLGYHEIRREQVTPRIVLVHLGKQVR